MASAPWPLIEIAVDARSPTDRENLGLALLRLATDTTSFDFSVDRLSSRMILKGMDEHQLKDVIDTLLRTNPIDMHIGKPEVSYRETITRRIEVAYTHEGQTGGIGQFARVKFAVEPIQPGQGWALVSTVIGEILPRVYRPSVEKGIDDVLRVGILAGFPVVNIRIELVDAAYHDIDSSALTFEIASRGALREALGAGNSQLLEPMMIVEVAAPAEDARLIASDLEHRRGQVQDRIAPGRINIVRAIVPLAQMLGYAKRLRSFGSGCATMTMAFSHYAPVPPDDGRAPPAVPLALHA